MVNVTEYLLVICMYGIHLAKTSKVATVLTGLAFKLDQYGLL